MLTIFTPSYNRKHTLPKLYESLKNQTSKDFLWLIVDDGSIDGTEDLVKSWQEENVIQIQYFYQQNAGKMQAHNKGVLETNTELFVCVDSDDWFVKDGVEEILNKYGTVKNEKDIAGIVAYKGKSESELIDIKFPEGLKKETLGDLYRKGFKGDTTLIYKTEVLKRFLFPIVDGEKFMTENYIYAQIDEEYKLILFPKICTVCEYLEDGYSKNIYKVFNKNPKSMCMYYNLRVKLAKGIKEKLKYSVAYVCFSQMVKKQFGYNKANSKFLYFITYPLGIILYLKRRRYEK